MARMSLPIGSRGCSFVVFPHLNQDNTTQSWYGSGVFAIGGWKTRTGLSMSCEMRSPVLAPSEDSASYRVQN